MTDTLRDRIQAIISAHPLTYSGNYCECNPKHQYADYDSFDEHTAHLADALIAELNLDPWKTFEEGSAWEHGPDAAGT